MVSKPSNPPTKPKTKEEQEAHLKAARRAEQANILAGIRPLLEKDEQLLAFARARIAGGWQGKLNVGPEAFFAPFVNIVLTEQRFMVQHVRYPDGRPGGALPHIYAFAKIKELNFTEIETFGTEPACRLIVHLENGLYVRLRLRGLLNVESAKTMEKVFNSLMAAKKRPVPSPTRSVCVSCNRPLDQHYRYCPFCGKSQSDSRADSKSEHGITLATGVADGTQTSVSPLPTVSVEDLNAVALETDFAYEVDASPASFGDAPNEEASDHEIDREIDLEAEMGKYFGTNDDLTAEVAPHSPHTTTRRANGSTTTDSESQSESHSESHSEEETLEALAHEDLFASGTSVSSQSVDSQQLAPETVAEERGDGDVAMFDLPLEPVSPEEPIVASDPPAQPDEQLEGVAFQQEEEQPFTELPFSDTPEISEHPISEKHGEETE